MSLTEFMLFHQQAVYCGVCKHSFCTIHYDLRVRI